MKLEGINVKSCNALGKILRTDKTGSRKKEHCTQNADY